MLRNVCTLACLTRPEGSTLVATIIDVAGLAGVSISTVSHVINGTRPVSDGTRRRVLAAIDASGYSPDGLARALRRKRSDSIGLVVSDTGQHGFAELARGVEREASTTGQTLLLANSDEDPKRELTSVRALLGRRVDGLLVARVAESMLGELTDLAGGTPIVFVDRLSRSQVDQVGVENAIGMRRIVHHLVELGHRRIGLSIGDARVPTLAERYQGFADALREAGLAPDDALIVRSVGMTDNSRAATVELLRSRKPPTALVSASDLLTMGALQAIREVGVRVPDDLAFVCVDRPSNADLFFVPELTCVVQPFFEVGGQAMRLLARRLSNAHATPTSVRLRPEIIHGGSCGCPAGSEDLLIEGPAEPRSTSPRHVARTSQASRTNGAR